MAKAYQLVVTKALEVDPSKAMAIKESRTERLFTIVYGRPPDKPDIGYGRSVPWKKYPDKVQGDGGKSFYYYLTKLADYITKKGTKLKVGNLQTGFAKMRAFADKYAHVKGPARVYKGKVYNEKHIAMMEAAARGEGKAITPKTF
jgi:hypothetical protein